MSQTVKSLIVVFVILLMLLAGAFCYWEYQYNGAGEAQESLPDTWAVITPNGTELTDIKPEPSTAPVGEDKNEQSLYDVIVAGGEPEGITSAVAAAESGLKVLLVCEEYALGGLMTVGELNVLDLSYYQTGLFKKNILTTQGFFQKFYDALGNSFDLEDAKTWFMQQVMAQQNITLLMETDIVAPLMKDNTIIGLKLSKNATEKDYYAKRVIDATVDADIAAAAGVPYSFGTEDYGGTGYQAVTLVFELSGVSYEGVENYVRQCHAAGNYNVGIDATSAYGYGEEAKAYVPTDKNMRLRGPNIGFQKNGNVLINALLLSEVNPLDEKSYAEGIVRAKKELPYVVEFMQKSFMGFENCALVRTADELYVRETRHIYGEYRMSIDDVLENRDFEDKIAMGSYPVDIQPISAADSGAVVGNPTLYAVPYRCTVPLKIENLWVVGRSASYDSLPHGSIRTIPVGMAVAEGVGVACAYSVHNELSPRELCNNEKAQNVIKSTLQKRGAFLEEINVTQPAVMSHWAYEGVKVIRSLSMLYSGYDNNYHLEEAINKYTLANICKRMSKLLNRDYAYFDEQIKVMNQVSTYNAAYFAAYLVNDGKKPVDYPSAVSLLEEAGIIDALFYKNYSGWETECNKAEAYYLLGRAYKYINGMTLNK